MTSSLKYILAAATLAMPLTSCEKPGPMGEPKTLLSVDRCRFYEQAYSDQNAVWKDDPWWVVYLTCETNKENFIESLFRTRYPDFYKFYLVEDDETNPSIITEYCQYRSAPSFSEVQNRIAVLAEEYKIGFKIRVTENKEPCIAAGSELYE